MKEFRITVGNRPGELARVAENLSRKDVNIKAIAASASGGTVTLHLIGHDIEATRAGLTEMRAQFTEREVIPLLLEDKAGALAVVAKQLADAGINIDAIYLTGKADDLIELALAVEDVKKAKKVLNV
ncbi:MAG: hypothetical protein HY721_07785 [Planctomycetes bacterium]|nr:hypothetical protein [Planctomycetota bacterium]